MLIELFMYCLKVLDRLEVVHVSMFFIFNVSPNVKTNKGIYTNHNNSLHSDVLHTAHQLVSYYMLCGLIAECFHCAVQLQYNLDVEVTPSCLIAPVRL